MVESQVERLRLTMERLGWEIDYCSKYQDEVERAGWIPFMDTAIYLAKNIVVIRTEAGFRRGQDRGIDEEIALIRGLREPMIKVLGDGWQDLDDSEFEELCKDIIDDFERMDRWREWTWPGP